MIEMLKLIAIWLLFTIGAFAAIYLFGSFCTLTFDITSWTSTAGRFTIAFLSGIIGMMGVCGVDDMKRAKSMTLLEREQARAAHLKRHSHADY